MDPTKERNLACLCLPCWGNLGTSSQEKNSHLLLRLHLFRVHKLLLNQLGELPLDAQVKLLRVTQEGTVKRIGASNEIKVDVRLIAATNRNLSLEVIEGRFREDLFYRLAIAIINIDSPPKNEALRELRDSSNILSVHSITL